MKLFIVAVPLFNTDMTVDAYNLHYQSSSKLFGQSDDYTALDGAMYSPGLDMLDKVGIEPFTGGKPIIVPINKFLILSDFTTECKIPPKLIIFALPKDLPLEQPYIGKCQKLKADGYSLAIAGIKYSDAAKPVFDIADYFITDTTIKGYTNAVRDVRMKYPRINMILTKIADITVYESLKTFPNTYFEGKFYNQPITKGLKGISPLKANMLQLLKMVGDEDFELDVASAIIQRDTALSLSLLRFINSPAIGITNKVNSIKHAVALLGQKETRKWIMAFVSVLVAEDKPSELTKLSLTRAKFAENLATAFEMGIHAPGLFLMGLFSLLDVILEKPMKEAINEISVHDRIKAALVSSKGDFYDVLSLIYAYEQADWKTVSYIMIHKNIDAENINKAFFDSLVWYKGLLESIKN